MAHKIILKKSNIAGRVPANTVLEVGEVAINLSDRVLHSKNANGEIFLIAADPVYNTGLQDKLDAKADVDFAAPLASPSLTGIPTAPTPLVGSNTTQIATTQFVETRGLSAEDFALAMSIALG